jgi:hypothetical protein
MKSLLEKMKKMEHENILQQKKDFLFKSITIGIAISLWFILKKNEHFF